MRLSDGQSVQGHFDGDTRQSPPRHILTHRLRGLAYAAGNCHVAVGDARLVADGEFAL